mmetsp:Transcript_79545/g.171868  ORF Transcript_79545/g.171868 Transcript_79545/m.171868 type:complete len:96 (-) Transcript_79545:72-359(-)
MESFYKISPSNLDESINCKDSLEQKKYDFFNKIKNDKKLSQEGQKQIDWIKQKLNGNDFDSDIYLTIEQQVDQLIKDAASDVLLCQCYKGWVPWW